MSAQQPAPNRRVDSDGVVRIEHRRTSGATWVLRLGIVFTCVFLALSAWLVFDTPTVESLPIFSQQEPPPPRPHPAPPPRPVPARPPLPKHLQAEVAAIPQEVLEQIPEGVFEMPKPGEAPTGLMLFPAPGTDPLKKGIIVPEDFELPPGYVRHYQATDDGERLPAILMFSPDGPPLDANGQPMKVTENGIVPPELAPPGMPIQLLEEPKSGETVEQEP
ncbi:hypothetical protein POL68_04555 [Stigmatella sp. ncwal1]|uniref:Uncharacterized protein n=1 Tax=Stigmatella ashevillensis TaxID=2995309 RepID=A0ABT5D672_9BACT|nr:hypothetical protein [Stigmatella ashevillena]MDC0707732.1 hypothetical protein [Stigmatella ashevillena]